MRTPYSSSSLRLLAARAVGVLGSYVLERMGVDSPMTKTKTNENVVPIEVSNKTSVFLRLRFTCER